MYRYYLLQLLASDYDDSVRIYELALNATDLAWTTYAFEADDDGVLPHDDLADRFEPWAATFENATHKGVEGVPQNYRPYFERVTTHTPVVTAVRPSDGGLGTSVHVWGTGFSPNMTDAGVSIAVNAVRAANSSCITRSVGNITAPGRYGVLVRSALGIAS